MKKSLGTILDDADVVELMQILLDDDSEGALAFRRAHLKGKAGELHEGGWKVQIHVPGAGTTPMQDCLFKK